MNIIQWSIENKENIFGIIGLFYSLATAIAVITPSNKDNTVLEKIGALADRIGLNLKGK